MDQTALSVQISQNRPQNLSYLKMSRIFPLYYKWLSAIALMEKETFWRDPTLLKPQLHRISKKEKGRRSPNSFQFFHFSEKATHNQRKRISPSSADSQGDVFLTKIFIKMLKGRGEYCLLPIHACFTKICNLVFTSVPKIAFFIGYKSKDQVSQI